MTDKESSPSPFLFAEESGLALFKNQRSGKKFWIDHEHWQDLVSGLQSGWQPGQPEKAGSSGDDKPQ